MVSSQHSKTMIITNKMEEENQYNDEKLTGAGPFKKVYIKYKYKNILQNILFFTYVHVAGVYGLYILITSAKWTSIIVTTIIYFFTMLGITAGAHRLFSHKSYKARTPLLIFLMLCQCLSYQRTLVTWVRDHRLHHKYSDTDADPHNINRGFFFAHIGWLLVEYHPEVKKRKGSVDMRDVYSNKVVMFQKRNKQWLLPMMAFIIPTLIPWLLGDTYSNSWHLNIFRCMLTYNISFITNSVAHSWGYKPYDNTMKACQNLSLMLTPMGEGFHNYHHAFPYDYRAAELGNNEWNTITKAIDFFATLGMAYDLKMANEGTIKARITRTGDGTDLRGHEIKGTSS